MKNHPDRRKRDNSPSVFSIFYILKKVTFIYGRGFVLPLCYKCKEDKN